MSSQPGNIIEKDRTPAQKRSVQNIPPARQVRRLFRAFREFSRLEAAGGIILMFVSLVALVWANSPFAESYFNIWHIPLTISAGGLTLAHDLHWWINEALMVIFFFVVGLEIKREIMVGELSSPRQAALPVVAAIGGMIFPALIYAAINFGLPTIRGWGVPMATDIAFALGVMALLGRRVPIGLKIFLTALAIVDDLGAVMVIALFYTAQVSWTALGAAALILFILMMLNLQGVRSPIPYALFGIALWAAFLTSGVHATLAGVLLAITIPARAKIREKEFLSKAWPLLREFEAAPEGSQHMISSEHLAALQALEDAVQDVETPLQRLEHALHPWVTFLIIPLFAFANAGVTIGGNFLTVLANPVSLGIIFGLVLGKQLGISLAAWLTVKTGLGELPEGVNWFQIYAVSWLGGIGFTMSLFISSLAFGDSPEQDAAKLGILVASVLAGGVGFFIFSRSSPPVVDEPVE